MKKITVLALIFLLSMLQVMAQSNAVSLGGEATGSGGSASFTAGEVFYRYKQSASGSATEGVQQPYERPTASLSGTTTICAGATAQLSISFTGTAPFSGTLSDGTPFSGSSSPISVDVTPASNTTYTIASLSSAVALAATADLSDSAVITVNALPVVSLSNFGSLCSLSSAYQLSGGLPAGGVYSGTGVSLNNGNYYFDPSTAGLGTQSITYTYNDGCENSASENITVNLSPTAGITITGSTTLFVGDSVLLTATTNASVPSYLWSNGTTNSTLKVKTAGSFSVTIKNSGSCPISSSSVATTLVIIPNTSLASAYCPFTVSALNSYVYCKSVSGATNYQYEFKNTGLSFCDSAESGSTSTGISLSNFPGLHYATTYDVRVRANKSGRWGTFSNICQITTPSIPSTGLASTSCGASVSSLTTYVYCNSVTGATNYQYEFTDSVRNRIDTISVGGTQLSIPLSRLPIVHYATTYRVRVRAKKGSDWGSFAGVCRITTPLLSTGLASSSCGATVSTLTSTVYCNSVAGATNYQYEFTDSLRNRIDTISVGGIQLSFPLSRLPIIHYATTYRVRVRAQKGGDWGAFTGVCRITTPLLSTGLASASCGATVSTLTSNVYCNSVAGATNYQYEFTDSLRNRIDTISVGGTQLSIPLSRLPIVHYATTYRVRVRAQKGGDWGAFTSVCRITTPSIPSTGLASNSCGATVGTLTSYVYCNSVTSATNYQYEFTDSVRNRIDTISVGGTQLNISLSRLPIVHYATTYRVRVRAYKGSDWGSFAGVCRITTPSIPSTGLASNSCGASVGALNSYIYCNSVIGSTNYQYELTDTVRNIVQTVNSGGTQLSISLSLFANIHYGTTYRVRVRAYKGSDWGSFGSVCRITTPSIPSSALATCNSIVSNTSSFIYCNSVLGSTNYSYEISNTTLSYKDTVARGSSVTSISLSSFPGLQSGKTYDVRVRAYKAPDWGPFGSVCTVRIGPAVRLAHQESTESIVSFKETEISVYPNPFNEFFVISSNSTTSVEVKIIDYLGRVCQKYTLIGNTSQKIGEDLVSGVYVVEAISGQERKVFKVVKME